jgi:hypothetical protein
MIKFIVPWILLGCLVFDSAIAQDKPLLSEAIRKEIDTQGIEIAKRYFSEQFQSQKDLYNIDMQGISAIGNAYAQAADTESANAVLEIALPFMQLLLTSGSNGAPSNMFDGLAEQEREEKTEREKQAKKRFEDQQQKDIISYQGQPRSDLDRFAGLYGDPAEIDKNKQLWVMVSCDGYLVSGAIWGDASPWWMSSTDDMIFTYKDSWNNIRMQFKTDINGKVLSMIHDLDYMKNPLERLGPVPDDYGSCLERPKR